MTSGRSGSQYRHANSSGMLRPIGSTIRNPMPCRRCRQARTVGQHGFFFVKLCRIFFESGLNNLFANLEVSCQMLHVFCISLANLRQSAIREGARCSKSMDSAASGMQNRSNKLSASFGIILKILFYFQSEEDESVPKRKLRSAYFEVSAFLFFLESSCFSMTSTASAICLSSPLDVDSGSLMTL